MHNNVKLNYRDSGDGKVSTRVDTRPVSKLQEGSNDVTCTEFKRKDNLSYHMKIWQGSSTGSKFERKRTRLKVHVVHVEWWPHIHFGVCQNTRWTVPLWSLGFPVPETYITCAIWRKDAQTVAVEFESILNCFEGVWKGRFEMTQVEGNNFHVMWQHGKSCAWSRSKKKTQKECMWYLWGKIPHFYYLYLPKIQTNST